MHGFRDNEVLLSTGYDAIVIPSPGDAVRISSGLFLKKSDHNFLIVFNSNFLSGMHGFRDNEVLLPTGFDVIVIWPPGGFSGDFT